VHDPVESTDRDHAAEAVGAGARQRRRSGPERTSMTPRRSRASVAVLGVLALAVVAIGWTMIVRRGGATAEQADRVPGHTRGIMHHDWPHPRDFKFAAGAFRAVDPSSVLFTTPTGVRAYVIPNDAE